MFKNLMRLLFVLLAVIGAVTVVTVVALLRSGIAASAEPGRLETAVASRVRSLAIPRDARARTNPVPADAAALEEGSSHFADHCATCHGNDGSGDTTMGRGLYPRAPDMRQPPTQQLTDGELLYIIENGVKLTGMPAWGDGSPESETASWKLVHFIRHLPKLTREEIARMESLNPRTPEEWRALEAERKVLEGGRPQQPAPAHTHTHPHGKRK
jgi:mono/diheme cytochrome c family protein